MSATWVCLCTWMGGGAGRRACAWLWVGTYVWVFGWSTYTPKYIPTHTFSHLAAAIMIVSRRMTSVVTSWKNTSFFFHNKSSVVYSDPFRCLVFLGDCWEWCGIVESPTRVCRRSARLRGQWRSDGWGFARTRDVPLRAHIIHSPQARRFWLLDWSAESDQVS